MISLFDAKGFKSLHQEFKNLDNFLSTDPNGCQPTVWDLNGFCGSAEAEPPRPILADYGFYSCKTAKDRLDLKDVSMRLLPKINPIDLHRACMSGELYAFAKRDIAVDLGLRG